MAGNPGSISSQVPYGDDYLVRRIDDAARAAKEQAAARSGQATQIGSGGLLVNNNGNVTIEGGGTLILNGVDLATIVAATVSPAVGSSSTSGFALSTSYSSLTSFNIVAPSGYTRAIVLGIGGVNGCTASSSGDQLTVSTFVNGAIGAEMQGTVFTGTRTASVTAVKTASLAGLTAGASINIGVQAHWQIGPGSTLLPTTAYVSGQVIFLP